MKLLLTEGSSMTARDTLFALGPRHTIDVLDPSLFCQARFSRFVRRVYRCPPVAQDPEGYMQFLLQRLEQEQYDALVPSHEETYLLARHRDQLAQRVPVALPEFDAVHRVQGKAEFVRLLDELQLPQPTTRIVRDREGMLAQEVFPCFAKVDYSTAGNGVARARDRAQLEEIVARFTRQGWLRGENEIVMQEAAAGQQSVFYAIFQHGRLVGWHGMELRRPGIGGWAINGISSRHSAVEQQVAQLGEFLNWHGALFVDYFYQADSGRPCYIECNARPGGFFIAQLAGNDLAEQFLRVTRGEQVDPIPPSPEGARFHQSMVMLLSRAMEGATRRELVGELWRACRKRGFYANSEDTVTRWRDDWLSVLPATGISLLLLMRPQAAHNVVRNTVAKYALPEETTRQIRQPVGAAHSETA